MPAHPWYRSERCRETPGEGTFFIPSATQRPRVFTDVPLKDLTPERESSLRLAAGTWFGSFGFCTSYVFPPASNVWVSVDEQGAVSTSGYYLECSWKGILTKLHMFGPTSLTGPELEQLLSHRKAAFATVTCMASDDVSKWSGPWYRCSIEAANEDVVIELPRSEEEYLHSLGHNARTQLPYYLRRVQKEWGDDYELCLATGSDISKEVITELVGLNRIRIERKGAVHLWHPQLIEQRWRLAQHGGLFCGLRHGGTLVAGTLSYLHRNEAYFVLIGHQTEYDRLRLGKLVLWLTIQRLIQMGLTRYHLLWGMSSYKMQLGGQPHTLFEVTVFRRPWVAVLWHLGRVFDKVVPLGRRVARIPAWAVRKVQAAMPPKMVVGKGT